MKKMHFRPKDAIIYGHQRRRTTDTCKHDVTFIIAPHRIFASMHNCYNSHYVLTNLELLVSKPMDVVGTLERFSAGQWFVGVVQVASHIF